MKRYLAILLLMQTWLTAFLTLQAADTDVTLPATFVRVSTVDDLTADGCFVIAGVTEERTNFMGATYAKNDKTHLQGYYRKEGLADTYECRKRALLWRITPNDDGTFCILSDSLKQYVSRKDDDEVDLVLTNQSNNKLSKWSITTNADGTFIIRPSRQSSRSIQVQKRNDRTDWFGNYNGTGVLHIYKKAKSFTDTQGRATLPTDQSRVLLCSGSKVWNNHQKASLDAEDYQLCNGSLADDAQFQKFICYHEANNAFALMDESTQTYLTADLSLSATKTLWQISNGYIQTHTSTGENGILCYTSTSDEWAVLTAEEAAQGNAVEATLCCVADAPRRETSAQGVTALSGGWSATSLANLDWKGTKCLDLTQISLPRHLRPFTSNAETQNLPIFVPQQAADIIPDDWKFVVACEKGSNTLLRSTDLAESEPFFTDRNIYAPKGLLKYSRQVKSTAPLQTICLPFSTDNLPSGCIVYALTEQSAEDVSFASVTQMQAGKAYILVPQSATDISGTITLTFTNAACTLSAVAPQDDTFCGTFEKISIGSTAQKTYMLSADTKSFRLAASGSTLPPFRAALRPGSAQTKNIQFHISLHK